MELQAVQATHIAQARPGVEVDALQMVVHAEKDLEDDGDDDLNELDPLSGKKKRRSSGSVPRWTPAEEEQLRVLVAEHGERSWQAIADVLNNGRTASAVDQHWSIMMGKRRRESTRPRDQIAVAIPHTRIQHEVVTATLAAPSPSNGGKKAKRERRSVGKSQRWSQDEEAHLKALVEELGAHGHWDEIAKRLQSNRTGGGVEQHWQILSGRRKTKSGNTHVATVLTMAGPAKAIGNPTGLTATVAPTMSSVMPTSLQSVMPTAMPMAVPTVLPNGMPTGLPTAIPTVVPTAMQSALPASALPTTMPSTSVRPAFRTATAAGVHVPSSRLSSEAHAGRVQAPIIAKASIATEHGMQVTSLLHPAGQAS